MSALAKPLRMTPEPKTSGSDSEQRMRALFQQAPGFICILTGPNHVFEFTNDSYRRLLGGRDLIGKCVREAIPEVEGQGYLELLDNVYQSGKSFKGLEVPLKLRRTSDGLLDDLLIDFIYQPIVAETGEVSGIFVEGYDVSERAAAQAALRQSEARYRSLFNSIDEGFCIIEVIPAKGDRPGDYLYIAANPALVIQSGITVNVGKDTIRGLLSTEAQSWIDVFDEILRTGEPVRGERGLLSQGRVLDLYSFRLDDDTNRRVGIIFTDVTERKRAEAALKRANQDLEQFAYSASHDLHEPLRTVKIYCDLLVRRHGDRLDGEAKDFLGFVKAGANRMEMLVRDLLSYTQSSQIDESAGLTNADSALAEAIANLSASIEEGGAKVTSGPLPSVRVPATQLRQLFQNLIGNAIKYRRPDTPPVVSIAARNEGGRWLFSITDNGLGIDQKYRDHIFGLFKRLHAGDEYPGTGIGLAICQRIVENYHGRIWVDSELDRGSVFYFTLPD